MFFKAFHPLYQGIDKVGLLAVKLVLNLTLTHDHESGPNRQDIILKIYEANDSLINFIDH